MRTSTYITAFLLSALCANAEIIVYRGNMVEKRAGNATESTHKCRSLLILDHATGAAKRLDYYPGSSGFYIVQPDQQFITNRIRLKNGRTQSVLARAQSGGASEPVVAVFAKGINTRLQVAKNTFLAAPRILNWSLRATGPGLSGEPENAEETGVLAFHHDFTVAINNHQEGLPEAGERLKNTLEKLGYREVELQ